MMLNRPLAWGIAVLVSGTAVPALNVAGQPAETAIACTNPASGARWEIKVDFAHGTVDTNPAQISDTEISWHDAKDHGNYTLNRKSGELTVVIASSTGGYFLYDRCKLKN